MRETVRIRQSLPLEMCRGHLARNSAIRAIAGLRGVIARRRKFLLAAIVFLGIFPRTMDSQSLADSADSASTRTIVIPRQLDLTYERPTQETMFRNYALEAYGPYPIATAAVTGGINQWTNSPPEWGQGIDGFGKRFGSNVGIGAIETTTRYGLAAALREDTLYYRCECRRFLPRIRHALLSTLISRRGADGHRVFSVAALVAPYAGSMAAVYGWYPSRFGAKDAFRMGNYNLLTYAGGNIALEFFYSGPHSLLSRMHLNNAHGSPVQGPNQ